jgi:2,5-diketo-D-gluconate reductase A
MTSNLSTDPIARLELNDGRRIPQVGFGVFQVPPQDTAETVAHALRAGYRHIDTAAAYRNEAGVGEAIRESGLDRDEVFVTTKLWNADQGRDNAERALERSLERLGLEHVDLYLIHWPVPSRDEYSETWKALTEFQSDGRARSIGVSNFEVEHLERIIAETGATPAVNQIELHPSFQQAELRSFHDAHGILTEAWSPLARQAILEHDTIVEIAGAVERTPAQVVLRWHLQLGNVLIPKSVTPERIEENVGLFDFELSPDQLRAIDGLDEAVGRMGPDPMQFSAA